MKRVYQTIKHGPGQVGNCFQAAIASLLELDLDKVPHFYAMDEPFTAYAQWLVDHGVCSVEFEHPCDYRAEFWGYHMVIGDSPRHEGVRHCVIGYGSEIVHDPYPESGLDLRDSLAGDSRHWEYLFLAPLDPAGLSVSVRSLISEGK